MDSKEIIQSLFDEYEQIGNNKAPASMEKKMGSTNAMDKLLKEAGEQDAAVS